MSEARFPQTRAGALAQLAAFLPHPPRYAETRSRVEPGHPGVSRLSPAVRCRLITEDEIITETLRRYPLPEVEKWVQEVFWRRYWKGWLELRPAVWADYLAELAWHREHLHSTMSKRVEEVAAGRSGVALMDRFARELIETGYLHNHARMWWASFWIHVEKLPWELGADFFYRHLLDADPASNTLSWRWVAGVQTKRKTYLVSRSNLERHCAPELLADATGLERLADGAVEPFLPLLDEDDEEQMARWNRRLAANTAQRFANFPSKCEGLPERIGLWIHGEDLAPEVGVFATLKPTAIAAFNYYEPDQSPVRAAYRRAALEDAAGRATSHYGVQAELAETGVLAEALAAWARQGNVTVVVAFAPTVGPLQDQLPAVEAALKEAGVELRLFRRNTDFELWPHAREGYFNFWDQMKLWLRAKQKRGEFAAPVGPR
jgi:deoxyribodipyrimidine photo-lyase